MAALEPGSTIGIFGGGQLGRMLAIAAAELGLKTHIYSDVSGPAVEVATHHTIAPYEDTAAIQTFAQAVDVVTYEFENVPLDAVTCAGQHAHLAPGPRALEVAQDRYVEKTFVSALGIPVAPFANIEAKQDLERALAQTGTPAILKTRRLGYDGKGQARIQSSKDLTAAYAGLGEPAAVLEGHVNFDLEVSVLAVRTSTGEIAFYDLPENRHKDGILDTSTVPAQLANGVENEAHSIARKIADALDYIGVLAIELFVMADPSGPALVVNEIAPRVHNSGHWTLDACQASQFENHIRAVSGWPLAATDRHSNAKMTNLIGQDVADWAALASRPNTSLHLYGKADARPGRKMGHITEIDPLPGQNPADR